MKAKLYKTAAANAATVATNWWVVDATNCILGRLAAQVAHYIMGKHKAYYTPHVACGDKVIVLHADKIRLTGKKMRNKIYISHTGYPGGQRFVTPKELQNTHPGRILEKALKGMLPKNKLGRKQFHNAIIYKGAHHPHQAQQPKPLQLSF